MSSKKNAGPIIPHWERLADKLAEVSHDAMHGREVALTALATAHMSIASGFYTEWLTWLATDERRVPELARWWEIVAQHFPYLQANIYPLVGWLDAPSDGDDRALAQACGYLARVHMEATIEKAGGDLIGPAYTHLLPRSTRDARGIFYTPMSLARVMALMTGLPEAGQTINDPCCGTGGLMLATVKEMREAGRDPNEIWYLMNDVDQMAVALCGVNFACRGVRTVRLRCQNALYEVPDYSDAVEQAPRVAS